MHLNEWSRNAASAERARRRIHFRGETPAGSKVWTPKEDAICRTYRTYAELQRRLPHRSYCALRHRCQRLGLQPRRTLLTAADVSKLRRVYPRGNADQMKTAFPNLSKDQIASAARYYRVHRSRKPFVPTKIPILDEIRNRCYELCYSMPDLDEMARSRNYFAKASWHTNDKLNYRHISRAVEALGGKLTVDWGEK